ncbi:MAG: alkanesulfonate monooxygenase, partial [Proteobacteria bacterium]|nr:alkanesulfonate monooxygenase [Pseudomonadota bacterium]
AADKLVRNVGDEREAYIKTYYANSAANRRVQELRAQGDVIAPNLWVGLAKARPGAGVVIVGNPEQCANVLQNYIDIGCHSFCLSGYLHDAEAERFHRMVRPILLDRNRKRMAA